MGMNSHIHLMLDTFTHQKLREEAEKEDITVNELVRRKLEKQPTPEEVVLLRKLKENLTKKSGGRNNGRR